MMSVLFNSPTKELIVLAARANDLRNIRAMIIMGFICFTFKY